MYKRNQHYGKCQALLFWQRQKVPVAAIVMVHVMNKAKQLLLPLVLLCSFMITQVQAEQCKRNLRVLLSLFVFYSDAYVVLGSENY